MGAGSRKASASSQGSASQRPSTSSQPRRSVSPGAASVRLSFLSSDVPLGQLEGAGGGTEADGEAQRAARMAELSALHVRIEERRRVLKKVEKQVDDKLAAVERREAETSDNAARALEQRVRDVELKARERAAAERGDPAARAGEAAALLAAAGRRAEAARGATYEVTEQADALHLERLRFDEVERRWRADADESDAELRTRRGKLSAEKAEILRWDDRVLRDERTTGEAEARLACQEMQLQTRFQEERLLLDADRQGLLQQVDDLDYLLRSQQRQLERVCTETDALCASHAAHADKERRVADGKAATDRNLQAVSARRTRAAAAAHRLQRAAHEEEVRAGAVEAQRPLVEAKVAATAALEKRRAEAAAEAAARREDAASRRAAAEAALRAAATRAARAGAARRGLEGWRRALRAEAERLNGRAARADQATRHVGTWMDAMRHRERDVLAAEGSYKAAARWPAPAPLRPQGTRVGSLQEQYVVSVRLARVRERRAAAAAEAAAAAVEAPAAAAAAAGGLLCSRAEGSTKRLTLEDAPVQGVAADCRAAQGGVRLPPPPVAGVDREVLKAATLKDQERTVRVLAGQLRAALAAVAAVGGGGGGGGSKEEDLRVQRLTEADAHALQAGCAREAELAAEMRFLRDFERCPLNGGRRVRAGTAELLRGVQDWWEAGGVAAQTRAAEGERRTALRAALRLVAEKAPACLRGRAVPRAFSPPPGVEPPSRAQALGRLLKESAPAPTGPPRTKGKGFSGFVSEFAREQVARRQAEADRRVLGGGGGESDSGDSV